MGMPLIKQCLYQACQILQRCNCIRPWLLVAGNRADDSVALAAGVIFKGINKNAVSMPCSLSVDFGASLPFWVSLFKFFFLLILCLWGLFWFFVSSLYCQAKKPKTKQNRTHKLVHINSISYCFVLENND